MFTILSSRREDPCFGGFTILVNQSEFWLSIDKDGNQIPPRGIAAVDAEIASSPLVSKLVTDGLVVVSGDTEQNVAKDKKSKKQDLPQKNLESTKKTSSQPKPESTIVADVPILENDKLVAQPSDINWVSSNENIVDLTN